MYSSKFLGKNQTAVTDYAVKHGYSYVLISHYYGPTLRLYDLTCRDSDKNCPYNGKLVFGGDALLFASYINKKSLSDIMSCHLEEDGSYTYYEWL